MDKLKSKPKEIQKITPLPTMSDREMELESLLTAEEEDNYDRIDKQGMSDEFDKDVVDIAKTIYRKGKKVAKEFASGLKEGVKTSVKGIVKGAKDLIVDDTIEKAGKDMASGMTTRMVPKGVAKAIEDTSGDKE